MRVYVTQHDLNAGVRGHETDCAIARAITRATGLVAHVFKNDCVMYVRLVDVGGAGVELPLPREAARASKLLDANFSIAPFWFELIAPVPVR